MNIKVSHGSIFQLATRSCPSCSLAHLEVFIHDYNINALTENFHPFNLDEFGHRSVWYLRSYAIFHFWCFILTQKTSI